MNDMRKLMETAAKLDEEGFYTSVENDEAEQHLEAAAKAIAKDAVLQAAGVWDEEGREMGGYDTGAKTGKEYVRHAAPKFLDDEYKGVICKAFEGYFQQYVEYFIEHVAGDKND